MKPELYVAMMYNEQKEMICVSFLETDTDKAEERAKRYATQFNGTIVTFGSVADNESMNLTMTYRRPKEQNKP